MSSISSLNSLLSSSSPSTSSSSNSLDLSSLLAAATGASSPGIDVTSAVDAAIYAAQAPERQWQAQQSTLQSQISAVTSVQSALTALSSDLDALNDPAGAIVARTVSSSNSSTVNATADPGAPIGTHVVTVNHLATSASWYSPSLASGSSSLGTSSITITQGNGSSTTFGLGSGGVDSLSALATAINAKALGITASVVTDTTGSRLALVSNTSGSSANFSVSENGGSATTWNSASVASSNSVLSPGTFTLDDGSTTASISVPANSTLSDLANQINNQALNLSASVVTDSTGAHLAISGAPGNTVSVSSDPTFGFTQSSTGSDASLTVDGIPVSSASNTVTGVVSGLSINLEGATSGTQVTLSIGADANQISSALSQFVSDYNSALSYVSSQFTYNSTSGTQGALGSDGTIRSLQSMLLGVGSYIASTAGSSSTVTSLSSLGISMQNDGTLTVDTSALNQAITSDPAGVQSFLQGSSLNGFAASVSAEVEAFNKPSTGYLATDLNSLTQQYNQLQTNVDNYENGYIASQRTVLNSMYSKAEIALQQLPTTMKELQAQLGQNSSS